jgi:hypothetical protein
MSYPITTTNSTKLFDLLDGTTNSNLGVTLIGRNYTNYGEFQNENFVRLLENFASSTDPTKNGAYTPLKGTLWYDTTGPRMRVYDGTNWVPISERAVGITAPTKNSLGDQWYDSVNQQLFSWNGTDWTVVGPAYSAGQGKSGAMVETIIDNGTNRHTVVSTYTNNNLISITSFDQTFTPQTPIAGFGDIEPGINLNNITILNGVVQNALSLGGNPANSYARTDINSTFNQNVRVAGNLFFNTGYVTSNNSSLILTNSTPSGNIELYVEASGGAIRALVIDGITGSAEVPTTLSGISSPDAVTNKKYVDQNVTNINANVNALATSTTANLVSTTATLTQNINILRGDTNANLTLAQNKINANIDTLSNALISNVDIFSSNISALLSNVATINSTLLTLAPLNSATLTGVPTAPTPIIGDNSNTLATTAYVDTTSLSASAALARQISALQASLTNALTSGLALRAAQNNATLTGNPTAPTAAAGDNSTKLATTAFVTGAIAAQKFNYTVSPNPPSGGNNGDFWFQVG